MDSIPDVEIDDGRFKYVLIRVHDKRTNATKLIVRGIATCSYHMDIYELAQKAIENENFELEALGGGRILHNAKEKRIEVFGYSVDLGQAKHADTCAILAKHFPEYPEENITWTNQGY
ncbi:14 kDa phosphohistidine phosphatase-like [Varroa jacobsoni]|uniref:14 kDa phosphohistidine phosphatase n=1 Tax=Varroa destructor TaxID=109461 RepID=A0A7M7M6Y6_VARDE|nr:14 kDa phosphohistidine phosphatase-like [Varroa destructor]XP_022709913.1 14 kDa phosphohistidine phosphatase-like [Varroa jacobsoni]